MALFGDKSLDEFEGQLERNDPRFVHGLDAGRPPREYRRGPAWVLLAVSLTMLITGMMLPHGLLLVAGLVTAGAAAHLLAPP